MRALRYAQYNERAVGENHPTRDDTVNRALKDLIENSGLDPAAPDLRFLSPLELATFAGDLAALTAALAAEVSARGVAEAALAAAIVAEADARNTAISDEAADRSSADTLLSGLITLEASARSTADAGKAPLVHTHDAADIISGVLPIARIATGSPDGTKFVRDDGVLATPAGGGGGGGLITFPMVMGRSGTSCINLPASAIWATQVPTIFTIEFLIMAYDFGSFGGAIALGGAGDEFLIYFQADTGISWYPSATTPATKLLFRRDMVLRRYSFTRNGNAIKTYCDGVYIDQVTLGTAAAIALSNTARRLLGDGASEAMIGAGLADFRIWSDVRTDAEIAADAFERLTGAEADLLAYWPMDEGAGATVNDLGPNGWHGTIVNADWITAIR